MHDPKFEKEVQQKMEELVFSPSESVWARVEQAVNKKERRRVPLFWWVFLPALLLSGAGLIYFSGRTPHAQSTPVTGSIAADHAPAKPAPDQARVNGSPTSAGQTGNRADNVQPDDVQSGSTRPGNGQPGNVQTGNTQPGNHQPVISSLKTAPDPTGTASGFAHPPHDARTAMPEPGSPSSPSGTPFSSPGIPAVSSSTTQPRFGDARKAISPELSAIDRNFSKVTASRLAAISRNILSSPLSSPPVKLSPKYIWEAGFMGGIGISSLNQGLFRRTVVRSDFRLNAAPITGSPQTTTTQLQPDLSYWAGILLQRPIRKNFSVSLGLDLHYYSAKMKVGEKVTNYSNLNNPMANSLFIGPVVNAAQAQAPTAPYYSPGSDYSYTNRYYFLELPGAVQWRINQNSHMPLFWEGGFSLSYLVSSDALYYNKHSGVYFKDGTVSNKTQFNLSTAFMVGLPVRGMRLAVGPQLQYGLTDLLNSKTTGGEHLFYGGIKIVLMPGKGKK